MGLNVYLLNLSVCGIKNISEEVQIDFYKKVVNRNFDPEKFRVKAIYGENGSGKTAIITALSIVKNIILKERYLDQDDTQFFLAEIINKKTQSFSFSCEFLYQTSDQIYIFDYDVALGKSESEKYIIKSEKLKVKNGNTNTNSYRVVFDTRDGELVSLPVSEEYGQKIKNGVRNLLYDSSFVNLFMYKYSADTVDNDERVAFELILTFVFWTNVTIYLEQEDRHENYLFTQMAESITDKDNEKRFTGMMSLLRKQAGYYDSQNKYTISKDYYA